MREWGFGVSLAELESGMKHALLRAGGLYAAQRPRLSRAAGVVRGPYVVVVAHLDAHRAVDRTCHRHRVSHARGGGPFLHAMTSAGVSNNAM
jgi:hypothetical protein